MPEVSVQELQKAILMGQGGEPAELPAKDYPLPVLDKLFKRVRKAMKAVPPKQVDAAKVDRELTSIKFGLRCLMAQGGYKVRQGIGMDNKDMLARADATVSLIMNVFMFIRAAEDVIVRHGLTDEYKALCENLLNEVGKHVPQPTAAELEGLKAMLGRMAKGDADGVQLSDAGDESGPGLGKEGLHDSEPQPPQAG